MALKAGYNDFCPTGGGAVQAIVPINYGAGNQTVLAATEAEGFDTGAKASATCSGLIITVAGDLEIITPKNTTARVVPFGKGFYPDFPLTQVNAAGSTAAGFYVF